MELLPVVSNETGWATLGLVTAGFLVWGVFLWLRERKAKRQDREKKD